jgi:hypothetical protein
MADRPQHSGYTAAQVLAVARALVATLRAAGEDLDEPRARGTPDAVVSSPRGPIGIDVVDASVGDGPPAAPPGLAEGGSDAALVDHLAAVLRSRCGRSYGMPTYCVLDLGPGPLSEDADAPAVAAALTIPAGCRFARVFLRLRPQGGGEPELYELKGPTPDAAGAGSGGPASAGRGAHLPTWTAPAGAQPWSAVPAPRS